MDQNFLDFHAILKSNEVSISSIDFTTFSWLSNEEKEIIRTRNPTNLHELQNLGGIRPDTILKILAFAKKTRGNFATSVNLVK
jgi:tRNA U34 5-carboxymethylaminomethyl modifying enzyme MnmG/GidA